MGSAVTLLAVESSPRPLEYSHLRGLVSSYPQSIGPRPFPLLIVVYPLVRPGTHTRTFTTWDIELTTISTAARACCRPAPRQYKFFKKQTENITYGLYLLTGFLFTALWKKYLLASRAVLYQITAKTWAPYKPPALNDPSRMMTSPASSLYYHQRLPRFLPHKIRTTPLPSIAGQALLRSQLVSW